MLTLILIITIAYTAAAHASTRNHTQTFGSPLPERIARTITATWACQDAIGQKRTRAASPWKPHSTAYRRWVLARWQERRTACRAVLSARGSMINRLNRGLDGTPMEGTGGELEQAGRRYGIHPAFIAAIAGTESSFGAAACRNNRYNAFGLSSCGSGWSVPWFRSWADAYDFMARFLTGRTNVTSGWPNARTTWDYHGYAACSRCWGDKTAYWMRTRFGLPPNVRYP
jgi:hypothetical protein